MSLKSLYKNLIKEYGDDALGIVGKNADGALPFPNIFKPEYISDATLPDLDAQAILKSKLIDKRLPYDHFENVLPPSAADEAAQNVIDGFQDSQLWGRFPRRTDILGPITSDATAERAFYPNGRAVMVPEIPTSDLVVDDVIPSDFGGWKGFTIRPHRNTALGRWFENASNNPQYSTMYNYPIGPKPLRKSNKRSLDLLPF